MTLKLMDMAGNLRKEGNKREGEKKKLQSIYKLVLQQSLPGVDHDAM